MSKRGSNRDRPPPTRSRFKSNRDSPPPLNPPPSPFMPIRPELRHYYRGPDWRRTRQTILDRAKHKCEQCHKPNHIRVFTFTQVLQFGRTGPRIRQMYWIAPGSKVWRDHQGKIERKVKFPALPRQVYVMLHVSHKNHQPGDDRPENLQALCQWCHFNHDQARHHETRASRKDQARPLFVMHSAVQAQHTAQQ
jgi:hypothetical protein